VRIDIVQYITIKQTLNSQRDVASQDIKR